MASYAPIRPGGSLILAWQTKNRKVLIVGGGQVAAGRIVSVKEADAQVTLICPENGLCDEVKHRIHVDKVAEWVDRCFQDSDLDQNYDMVLTAIDDHEESLRIGQLCRTRRIPVNVADVPNMCDFYFMSQHRDGPLQIAVSTNGQGPKLANMIRQKIASSLPLGIGETVRRMGILRGKVRQWDPEISNSGPRMRWVTKLCEDWGWTGMARLNSLDEKQQEDMFITLQKAYSAGEVPPVDASTGTIYLVGGGPGDPELITLKAQRLLQTADLVVSDRLIPQQVLDLVNSELRIARKTAGKSDSAQDELLEWCLEGLKKGLQVVRLKIGDPLLFGRGGEEVIWFRDRGYEPVLVPGISSAFSAPMAASIPVTHRGTADQVVITTGRGTKGAMPDIPEYHTARTLVVLMAVGRAADLQKILLSEKGYPSSTPISWIENANCPEERTIFSTVEQMAKVVEEQNIVAPAVLVVGRSITVLNTL
ncbi:tetrapyrrole methylase [Umbelopsis sp. PMI_123]|nr:tetrapyrrole methylase [Umbelopsis sp. PMI_123]